MITMFLKICLILHEYYLPIFWKYLNLTDFHLKAKYIMLEFFCLTIKWDKNKKIKRNLKLKEKLKV